MSSGNLRKNLLKPENSSISINKSLRSILRHRGVFSDTNSFILLANMWRELYKRLNMVGPSETKVVERGHIIKPGDSASKMVGISDAFVVKMHLIHRLKSDNQPSDKRALSEQAGHENVSSQT